MADDVLSAAELEALRGALSPPGARKSPGCAPRPAAAQSSILPYQRAVLPKLNERLVRSMAALHDRCSRLFAAELSTLLRRAASVKVLPPSQVTYGELTDRLDNPTCFNVLSVAPLGGRWILEISPAVLFPAIDCMLGGGRQGARIAARPLTDIELRLAARISGLFLRQLRAAWHDVVEFEPSVERVACSPHVSGIAQAGDAVIWTRFDVEFGPARGTLNLAIPIDSVQSLLARLASEPTAGPAVPPQPNPASDGNGATVELVACLARLRVSADDVRQLAVGDVITTEQRVDAPIEVVRDGKVRFRARAGAAAGHKAIEIDQVVSLPPDAAPRRP